MAKKATKKATTTKKKAATPKKSTTTRKAAAKAAKRVLSAEERYNKICETAYFIAEERNFENGSPEGDWLEAERRVDSEFSHS